MKFTVKEQREDNEKITRDIKIKEQALTAQIW